MKIKFKSNFKNIFNQKSIIFLLFLTILILTSCTPNKKLEKKDNTLQNTKEKKIVDNRYKNNSMVSSYDVNKDGKADMWKIYKEIKVSDNETKKVLLRREIDLNFNGKINYYKFYTEKGNIEKEYLDLNLDGVIDLIRFYEKNLIIREEHYTKNPIKKDLTIDIKIKPQKKVLYSNQKLTRIVIDRTGDGYLDQYLFFKKNKLIQIGFDDDNDGKIDTRVRLKSNKTNKDALKNERK